MIDIHTHILFGVDDGAPTLEEAVEMCQQAIVDGITHVVATPHWGRDGEPDYDLAELYQRRDQLQQAVGSDLIVMLGAELYVSADHSGGIETDLLAPFLAGQRYLLLELPAFAVPHRLEDLITTLLDRNITPIITHPECNRSFMQNPERLERLVSLGAFCQINSMSLTGAFGPKIYETAADLLRRGLAHVIASDAHDPCQRPPRLSGAMRAAAKIVGSENALRLVEDNPKAIIEGRPLPALGPYQVVEHSLFRRLFNLSSRQREAVETVQ